MEELERRTYDTPGIELQFSPLGEIEVYGEVFYVIGYRDQNEQKKKAAFTRAKKSREKDLKTITALAAKYNLTIQGIDEL